MLSYLTTATTTTTLLLLLLTPPTLASPSPNEEPQPKSYTSGTTFRTDILNATNTYRHQHAAPPLTWNATLASTATKWSERCIFEHSGGDTGENLSSGYANASAAVIAWGDERDAYDFEKGEFDLSTGHFTQLVWKETESVGCGRARCDGDKGKKKMKKRGDKAPGWFVVCEYWPRGNVLTQFTKNVQPQVNSDDEPGEAPPAGDEPPPEDVPADEEPKECPQGGICSDGERTIRGGVGMGMLCLGAFVLSVGLGW
ncbi:unnamed protein product [Periconia digitata]|uniref:SCP domain-containing protein n=1 Tax=Periconia digitata TaxID=1303443 RepID=A0A9W4XSC5_9PLEO|nr:unnamed protein product [Periconia digitata]